MSDKESQDGEPNDAESKEATQEDSVLAPETKEVSQIADIASETIETSQGSELAPEAKEDSQVAERTPEAKEVSQVADLALETKEDTQDCELTPETKEDTQDSELSPETNEVSKVADLAPETKEDSQVTDLAPETKEATQDSELAPETKEDSQVADPAPETKKEASEKPSVDKSQVSKDTPEKPSEVKDLDKPAERNSQTEYDKDEEGNLLYTDPETKQRYKWSTATNSWVPTNVEATSSTSTSTPATYENEHYKWDPEKSEWVPKVQETETEHYKWDAEKSEWVPKTTIAYDIDEDGQRTYTDKDGAVFFWDADKNAWFPKIDDDFMARYQMNYGFIDNSSDQQDKSTAEKNDPKSGECLSDEETIATQQDLDDAAAKTMKRKNPANQKPPEWFDLDPAHNTKVYVSNLPSDITLDEFAEVMGKCGMIMRDPKTQKYKLKLYTEADGQLKGDGLCDYIKVESVNLALQILDEYDLRGHKMRVQRAKFEMRGDYNPALKPKRKKKDKEKLQKIKEKLFDWRPEKMRGERSKNDRIVIIKNLFSPEIFEKEVELLLEYQNDLRDECSKCGTVRKVVIYDRHPEGVAQVNMATPEEADVVIQMMHSRFFGKRQLTADHWDGKTKYKIDESECDVQKRISNWDEFLDAETPATTDSQEKPADTTA